jgi:hypothetical protein
MFIILRTLQIILLALRCYEEVDHFKEGIYIQGYPSIEIKRLIRITEGHANLINLAL